jgi:predicted RNA-binding Zn-ribbon protein involved in translation (DUF1610 family)
VGRRGVKEYRPHETLQLILADRDRDPLACPSCGNRKIQRTPRRRLASAAQTDPYGRVILKCTKCGRQAFYVPTMVTQPSDSQLLKS